MSIGVSSKARTDHLDRPNEDAASVAVTVSHGQRHPTVMCSLADGMGTLQDSAEASALAARRAIAAGLSSTLPPGEELAVHMLSLANEDLLAWAGSRNVGTTLTCAIIFDSRLYFSHVGDCRLYHISSDAQVCLTTDHTALAEQLGIANPDRTIVKSSAASRRLTLSLGERPIDIKSLNYGTRRINRNAGECVLICSDGVWTEVDPAEMAEIALGYAAERAAAQITAVALDRDPTDDVSVLIVSL